jgi:hypothetical protein
MLNNELKEVKLEATTKISRNSRQSLFTQPANHLDESNSKSLHTFLKKIKHSKTYNSEMINLEELLSRAIKIEEIGLEFVKSQTIQMYMHYSVLQQPRKNGD